MGELTISNLTASVGGTEILKGLNLTVPFGEVHAIMGPNGSGKSTLCHVLTGKDMYDVEGSIVLNGEELSGTPVHERAQKGLLQGFQYPVVIPGVGLRAFMEEALDAKGISQEDASRIIEQQAERFGVDGFLDRALNDELSGGERKRSEMFQLASLDPSLVLLDEIDSGLDIDAVREVAEAVEELRAPDVGILIITHYSRILNHMNVDKVHIMIDGRIVDSGGPELADELEGGGYDLVRERLGLGESKVPASIFDGGL
jgi:Fe-S cluster assembly ATP-binding protein